jgi:acyl-CoA synthetase (AMP-forming)/AMP-acid ligase II
MLLGSVINDLKRYKCTGFAGVPSHYQILLRKSDAFKKSEFPDLMYVTQAGGKLHNAFILEFMEAFPNVKFFVMYGQTEATARLSYLPHEFLPEKVGSLGRGIPGVQLEVVDEHRQPVQPNVTGEIIAKGDNVMLGYFEDDEATRSAFYDGWLLTGDLAYRDEDGFIYLTARKKEIIKVGGKRVSPKEIEEVIVAMPGIVDCSIEAIDDEILGEAIKAILVVSPSEKDMTIDKVRQFCATRLATYKIPTQIEFVDEIKTNSTGKKVKY